MEGLAHFVKEIRLCILIPEALAVLKPGWLPYIFQKPRELAHLTSGPGAASGCGQGYTVYILKQLYRNFLKSQLFPASVGEDVPNSAATHCARAHWYPWGTFPFSEKKEEGGWGRVCVGEQEERGCNQDVN